jgi:hypothetical protein
MDNLPLPPPPPMLDDQILTMREFKETLDVEWSTEEAAETLLDLHNQYYRRPPLYRNRVQRRFKHKMGEKRKQLEDRLAQLLLVVDKAPTAPVHKVLTGYARKKARRLGDRLYIQWLEMVVDELTQST